MKIDTHVDYKKIGNIEKSILYKKISETPSMNRSYKHIDYFLVRGLFYQEVVEMSKLNSYSLNDAVRLYSDAIKIPDNSMTLEDLELADFLMLAVIVNLMTEDNFEWTPSFKCDNIIKDSKLEEYQEDYEYVSDILVAIEDTIKDAILEEDYEKAINGKKEGEKNLEDLKKKIEEEKTKEKEDVICDATVSKKFSIFDLDFLYDDIEIPVSFNLDGVFIDLEPLRVKDYIDLDLNLERYFELYNVSEELIVLSKYTKRVNGEIVNTEDVIELPKYSKPNDIIELKDIIQKLDVEIKPVEVLCPKCKKKYYMAIKLEKLKAFPRLFF